MGVPERDPEVEAIVLRIRALGYVVAEILRD